MKRCTKCKRRKNESEFYKDAAHKDGLRSWCKECQREYKRTCYRKVRKDVKKYYRYEESHRVVEGVKQKRCSKCKKWKAESEFHKKLRHKDGRKHQCKKCERKYSNDYYRRDGKRVKKYRRYEESHRVVDGVRQKECSKCKRWKAENEFYRQRSHTDGLRSWCKECHNEPIRTRYRIARKVIKEYYRYEELHRVVGGVKEKRCRRCKKWKDESQYCRSRRSKDGLQWRCKLCESKYARKYYRQKTKN